MNHDTKKNYDTRDYDLKLLESRLRRLDSKEFRLRIILKLNDKIRFNDKSAI